MDSFPGPGEDDGIGGVVVLSAMYQLELFNESVFSVPRPFSVPKRLDENKDRRGVGNWGLESD